MGALAGLALLAGNGAGGASWHWQLPAGASPPTVPADNPMTAAKVKLGRRLFYDADLSADGTMACATCHEQHRAFSEGNTSHPGVTGEAGRRNVPGLANVGWLVPLTFADPRQTTLEAQVATPLLGTHPVEMGMKGREGEIAARLGRDPCYRTMFARAFPEARGAIDLGTVSKAIAAFERTLVSRGSPFDRGALSAQVQAGKALFDRDCASCHAGALQTDLAYHHLAPADPKLADQGLFENTERENDRGQFRTPSLRNVTLTGPWWHDGSEKTLEGAIARHGKTYSTAEIASMRAFLDALADPEFTRRASLSLPSRACGKAL